MAINNESILDEDGNFKELDLFEMLRNHVSKESTKQELLGLIMGQLREGESSAFRLLEKALLETKVSDDYLDFTDDQFQKIIVLAAERIGQDQAVKKS